MDKNISINSVENKVENKFEEKKIHSYSIKKPLGSITIQINSSNIYAIIQKIRETERTLIGLGDVIIYAIARGLKKYPEFNSCFENELKIYPEINIGYFINIGNGAKLAVLKNADIMSLQELSQEIKNIALKYIRGGLSDSPDLNDTVAVTNLSTFGPNLITTPVFEHHSALISIASEFDSFELMGGVINTSKKFNLTLSFDVRTADCQKALDFLNFIKNILEKDSF